MGAASYTDPVQQQDGLRSVRNFVSLLSGAMGDQTYAGQDGQVVNSPGQFGVQGPNGVAVEGRPVVVAHAPDQTGMFGSIPPALLIGGAVAIAYVLTK